MSQESSDCTCPPTRPPFDLIIDETCPVHGDQAANLVIDAVDHGRVIAVQPPGRCELCGNVDETRPYGPNGEEVCFACGVKDEAAMERGLARRLGDQ